MITNEDSADVTGRVKALGWTTANLTVQATITRDEHATPFEDDCYDAMSIAAWKHNEWWYVGVTVKVFDTNGREWGVASLWGTEYGAFPITDEQGELIEIKNLDPLSSTSDYPLPDLINDALCDASQSLTGFVRPVIISDVTP